MQQKDETARMSMVRGLSQFSTFPQPVSEHVSTVEMVQV